MGSLALWLPVVGEEGEVWTFIYTPGSPTLVRLLWHGCAPQPKVSAPAGWPPSEPSASSSLSVGNEAPLVPALATAFIALWFCYMLASLAATPAIKSCEFLLLVN